MVNFLIIGRSPPAELLQNLIFHILSSLIYESMAMLMIYSVIFKHQSDGSGNPILKEIPTLGLPAQLQQ